MHVRRIYTGANRDRQGLTALARAMDNFTVPMDVYPTPEQALRSPELREKFDQLRSDYLTLVVTPINAGENQQPHPNSAEYNNQSLTNIQSWVDKINARRRAQHCQ